MFGALKRGFRSMASLIQCCWRTSTVKNTCSIARFPCGSTAFLFSRTVHPLAHARETVALLQREVPAFIAPNLWPHNSPNLNPVAYKMWGTMQDRVHRAKVRDVDDLKQRLIDEWDSLEQRSTSGVHDFVPVSMQKADISNSLCNLRLNFVVNWHCFVTTAVKRMSLFLTVVISQASAATRLGCGG